jgi:hypothetical protein
MYDPEFNLEMQTFLDQIREDTEIVRQEMGDEHAATKLCESLDNCIHLIKEMSNDLDNCFDEDQRKILRDELLEVTDKVKEILKQLDKD